MGAQNVILFPSATTYIAPPTNDALGGPLDSYKRLGDDLHISGWEVIVFLTVALVLAGWRGGGRR